MSQSSRKSSNRSTYDASGDDSYSSKHHYASTPCPPTESSNYSSNHSTPYPRDDCDDHKDGYANVTVVPPIEMEPVRRKRCRRHRKEGHPFNLTTDQWVFVWFWLIIFVLLVIFVIYWVWRRNNH